MVVHGRRDPVVLERHVDGLAPGLGPWQVGCDSRLWYDSLAWRHICRRIVAHDQAGLWGPPNHPEQIRALDDSTAEGSDVHGEVQPVISSKHNPGRPHGARVPSVGRCATESPPLMLYRASVVPTNLPACSRRTMRART